MKEKIGTNDNIFTPRVLSNYFILTIINGYVMEIMC